MQNSPVFSDFLILKKISMYSEFYSPVSLTSLLFANRSGEFRRQGIRRRISPCSSLRLRDFVPRIEGAWR